jgi:hypothetical protein
VLKHPVALALALALGLAVLVALAVSALVWAKSYAPLRVTGYGSGYGVSKKLFASDGPCFDVVGTGCARLTFLVRGEARRFTEFHVVVRNDGPWAVTIEHAAAPPYSCSDLFNRDSCMVFRELRRQPSGQPGRYALSTGAFRPLRVPAHAHADLWLRFETSCSPNKPPQYSGGTLGIPLVYRYLGHFERTQDVKAPFDFLFAC